MKSAAGRLRSSKEAYLRWQKDCEDVLSHVIQHVNDFRRIKVTQGPVDRPHLEMGPIAGGPFLLRDADFREGLRRQQKDLPSLAGVRLTAPVHPKLVSAEMESHGFMSAASEAQIPAAVLKGISDNGDADKSRIESDTGGFYRLFACSNAVLAALHILEMASS